MIIHFDNVSATDKDRLLRRIRSARTIYDKYKYRDRLGVLAFSCKSYPFEEHEMDALSDGFRQIDSGFCGHIHPRRFPFIASQLVREIAIGRDPSRISSRGMRLHRFQRSKVSISLTALIALRSECIKLPLLHPCFGNIFLLLSEGKKSVKRV